MANQKTYSIVINGLEKSVSDVESLLKQLNALEQRLSKVGGKELNVASKESAQILKEQAKNASLVTAEGQKQLQELERIKQANKEIAQVQKEIAQGIRDEDGAYTNTLAGKRAQLSEMKKELASMDMGDSDAWSKMRDEVGKLNAEVLELEKSYGVFNRQVGNYPEAAKGFAAIATEGKKADSVIDGVVQSVEQLKGKQLFQVDIAGQIVQFENLSQAISEIDDMAQRASAEMLALAAAGKENTEEFAKLNTEFEEYVSKAAELERARKYSDELKDSMSSTTRELDLAVDAFDSLTSVMQIGTGIAGLFGQNTEEIEKAMNRTVQIMSIAQGAQKLFNQARQQGTALNKLWTISLRGASKAMNGMTLATKLSATAMKALKVAIASTGIGLLVVAIGALVNGVSKWIEKNKEAGNSLQDLKEKQDAYANAMFDVYDVYEKLGIEADTTTKKLETASELIAEILGNFKVSKKQRIVFSTDWIPDENDLEALAKKYEETINLILKYQSELADDDLSNKETRRIKNIIAGYEALAAAYKRYIDIKADKNAAEKKAEEDAKKAAEEAAKKRKEAEDELAETKIENIKNEHKRTLAEINKNWDDQLKAVRERGYLVKELELEINKKYNEMLIAEEKRYQKQRREVMTEAYRDANESLFEIRTSDMEKELALLEEQEKLIERTMNNINVISPLGSANDWKESGDGIADALGFNLFTISQTVKQYQNEADNLAMAMRELYIAQDITQYEKSTRQDFADYLQGGLDKLVNVVGDIDGAGADLKRAMENIISYYNSADTMMMDEPAFTEGLSSIMGEVDKIVQKYQNSTEEMNDEDKTTLNTLISLWETFSNRRIVLSQQLQTRLVQIDDETYERLLDNQQNARQALLDGYKKQFEELETLRMSFGADVMTGMWDIDEIGNFAKQVQSIKKFKSEYEELGDVVSTKSEEMARKIASISDAIDDVDDEMQTFLKDVKDKFKIDIDMSMSDAEIMSKLASLSDDLVEQWQALLKKKKKLTVNLIDTEASQTELESFGDLIKATLDQIEMDGWEWSQAIAKVLNSGIMMATQMAQQVADMQYQNTMTAIENERKLIDEELDMIQDAYDEQEAITEAHNDRIESLEDELSTARGDRRQFLLDEINAEMAAREKSYNLQVKYQKMEEALQKKQENLEKKADEAERKRNIANKRIMLAQAIGNTALAVTNALATKPLMPLGIALAALAGTMGAVQIGTIAATKYASGGVIQGNSHAQGGVKVLGGSAEVEGGEYITNKRTTANNLALLEFINSKKTKVNIDDLIEFYSNGYNSRNTSLKFAYADGGQLPLNAPAIDIKSIREGYQDDRPIVVSVQEIEDVSKRVKQVKVLAGIDE